MARAFLLLLPYDAEHASKYRYLENKCMNSLNNLKL
jgi:hypothetical protein